MLVDNNVKKHLKEQKDSGLKGNLYHITQVKFAYNSNHIEGSKLSEDQTNLIFETNTVLENEDGTPINVDDIVETNNHFRLFDYIIDHCDENLPTSF